MPLFSADDLPSYRRGIDRAVRTWGHLADHIRARLTAALRRAHGTNLCDGFEGGPHIPRSFAEACLGFRHALTDLHSFEDNPRDFPWPQWGNRTLTLDGPLPDVDQWIASLDGIGEDEWRSRIVDPFRQHLDVASLYFQDLLQQFDRAKEAVIASSANQPATRLRIEKTTRRVLTEEHEREEADRLHLSLLSNLRGVWYATRMPGYAYTRTFSTSEVAQIFFGRSPRWLTRVMSDMAAWSPLRNERGFRCYTLDDIDKIAVWLLNRHKISVTRAKHTVDAVHHIREGWTIGRV